MLIFWDRGSISYYSKQALFLIDITFWISFYTYEACGGQGLKTENRIGIFKAEFDVQSTFEGDNNVLMQQVILLIVCHLCISPKGILCLD